VDLNGIVDPGTPGWSSFSAFRGKTLLANRFPRFCPWSWRGIATRGDEEQISGIYKHRLQHKGCIDGHISITPLVSKSGERIGRLLLFDDVTHRERMAEQMTQTEN